MMSSLKTILRIREFILESKLEVWNFASIFWISASVILSPFELVNPFSIFCTARKSFRLVIILASGFFRCQFLVCSTRTVFRRTLHMVLFAATYRLGEMMNYMHDLIRCAVFIDCWDESYNKRTFKCRPMSRCIVTCRIIISLTTFKPYDTMYWLCSFWSLSLYVSSTNASSNNQLCKFISSSIKKHMNMIFFFTIYPKQQQFTHIRCVATMLQN